MRNEMKNMKNQIDLNQIDLKSIEVEGVNPSDFPDFCDAYVSFATWKNGTPLTESECDQLTDEAGDLVNEIAHDIFL
jgi:hypothetical protein